MATLVIRGKGETYVRLRMEGLLNPMTSYVNVRINNSTTGAGSANLNSGGGTDDGGATYYSDEWTSSNLSPSTLYNFAASVETTQVYWYYASATTSASTRPLNWAWYTSKTSGTAFNITATEWNAFCGRINEFRVYKSLTNYSFTSAVSGNNAQASQINQARTAINAMTPPTSVPAIVSSNGNCLQSTVNGLRDSLNSVA